MEFLKACVVLALMITLGGFILHFLFFALIAVVSLVVVIFGKIIDFFVGFLPREEDDDECDESFGCTD